MCASLVGCPGHQFGTPHSCRINVRRVADHSGRWRWHGHGHQHTAQAQPHEGTDYSFEVRGLITMGADLPKRQQITTVDSRLSTSRSRRQGRETRDICKVDG